MAWFVGQVLQETPGNSLHREGYAKPPRFFFVPPHPVWGMILLFPPD
jgi:hypothetical protein